MFKRTFTLIALLSAAPLSAQPVVDNSTSIAVETQPLPNLRVARDRPDDTPEVDVPEGAIQWSAEELESALRSDEEQTKQLLNQAIFQRRWDVVERLYPIYRDFEQKDEFLAKYAEAGLARHQGELSKAIRLYREMIAERADLTPVRLDLAISLYEDKQRVAARDQFDKVLSDAPPEQIEQVVYQYIDALNQQNTWSFSGGLNYLKEDNINNVSKERRIENTGFIKGDQMMPRSGKGLSYYVSVSRDFNLHNNHNLYLENSLYGKSYWDNHDYDDITNRLTFGYVYQDRKNKVGVLPFYEKRWYGNKQYKDNVGLRLEYNRWLTPNLQTINAVEYAKQKYKDNKRLDGHTNLYSTTLFWLRNPQQFFYTGLDHYTERTGIKQYSSDLTSVRVGWGQEWGAGISTRLALSMGERKYKDKAVLGGLIPLNKVRKDKEYNVSVTVWKRDWHFLGITPKINYNWRKVSSSIPTMYSYNKDRFMLIFEKTF